MHFLMNRNVILFFFFLAHFILFLEVHRNLKKSFSFYQEHFFLLLIPGTLILLGASTLLLGTFLPESEIKYRFQGIGNIWFAFFACLIFLLLLLHLLELLFDICRRHKQKMQTSHARNGILFFSALLTSCILIAYGVMHARDVHVVHYSFSLTNPQQTAEEKTIKVALLGDFHLGVNSSLSHIKSMVEKTNAEKPDIIVIVGDMISSNIEGIHNPDAFAAALSGLSAPEGVYGIYGNHDVEEDLLVGFPVTKKEDAYRSPKLDAFMAQCGIRMLNDEVLPVFHDQILLAGRLDQEKPGYGPKRRKTVDELLGAFQSESRPVFVLEHEPVEYAELAQSGADVIFSGHTHNGQIFPANLILPLFHENAYGLKKIGNIQTLVTGGVGFYGPPMRIGTNSEVTIATIRF